MYIWKYEIYSQKINIGLFETNKNNNLNCVTVKNAVNQLLEINEDFTVCYHNKFV